MVNFGCKWHAFQLTVYLRSTESSIHFVQVAVRKQDGRLAYEDVYAFGHKDASATATFVRLTLKSIIANMSDPAVESRSLELTALHFVPILSG